jgi:hypothetical protein
VSGKGSGFKLKNDLQSGENRRNAALCKSMSAPREPSIERRRFAFFFTLFLTKFIYSAISPQSVRRAILSDIHYSQLA